MSSIRLDRVSYSRSTAPTLVVAPVSTLWRLTGPRRRLAVLSSSPLASLAASSSALRCIRRDSAIHHETHGRDHSCRLVQSLFALARSRWPQISDPVPGGSGTGGGGRSQADRRSGRRPHSPCLLGD